MSTVGDILKAVREVLLLQAQVARLEEQIDEQNDEMKRISRDLIGIDKRVVRIEAMIEVAGRSGGGTPRIER